MKLQQLFQENSLNSDVGDIHSIIEAVYGANPFFQERQSGAFLLRGIRSNRIPSGGVVGMITPRTDRRPSDSSNIIHTTLDGYFLSQFGIPYRSEGVFVTADKAQANGYGEVFIMLPQGDFRFVWGEHVIDAYMYFNLSKFNAFMQEHASKEFAAEYLDDLQWGIEGTDVVRLIRVSEEGRHLWEQWISERMADGKYSDRDLDTAMRLHNEIMIKCKQYAIINPKVTLSQTQIKAASDILGIELPIEAGARMPTFLNVLAEYV